MLSTLVPMTVDRGLDRRDVLLGNGSFSDGKRQHFNCISERIDGRQQKMKGSEKNLVTEWGEGHIWPNSWVEMKNDGLKTGVKTRILDY